MPTPATRRSMSSKVTGQSRSANNSAKSARASSPLGSAALRTRSPTAALRVLAPSSHLHACRLRARVRLAHRRPSRPAASMGNAADPRGDRRNWASGHAEVACLQRLLPTGLCWRLETGSSITGSSSFGERPAGASFVHRRIACSESQFAAALRLAILGIAAPHPQALDSQSALLPAGSAKRPRQQTGGTVRHPRQNRRNSLRRMIESTLVSLGGDRGSGGVGERVLRPRPPRWIPRLPRI